MSNSHCSTEVSAPSAIASFATLTVTKLAALITAWQNRRAFYAMGHMSDYELSDIGLTRADLHSASRGSLMVDPTVRLGVMAHTTREVAARCNA